MTSAQIKKKLAKRGGCGSVQLSSQDFRFGKAAHKPTTMAPRLADALFSKETLLHSMVHGTKDYAPLDQQIIAVIKGKFRVRHALVNISLQNLVKSINVLNHSTDQ